MWAQKCAQNSPQLKLASAARSTAPALGNQQHRNDSQAQQGMPVPQPMLIMARLQQTIVPQRTHLACPAKIVTHTLWMIAHHLVRPAALKAGGLWRLELSISWGDA